MTVDRVPALDLYGLPDDYAWLLEVPEHEGLEFEGRLDTIQEATADQMLRCGYAVRSLEETARVLRAHQHETAGKADAIERRVGRLKAWMLSRMAGWGLDRAKDARIHVYRQRNPDAVEVVDPSAVPDEYKRATLVLPLSEVPEHLVSLATVEVMKSAILKALREDGVLVDGVNIVQGEHVRVR